MQTAVLTRAYMIYAMSWVRILQASSQYLS